MVGEATTEGGHCSCPDIARAIASDPARTDLRFKFGILLFRGRRFAEAATQFAQLARQAESFDKSLALLYLARTLARLGMLDHARNAAEMAATDSFSTFAVSRVLRQISALESRLIEDSSASSATQNSATKTSDVQRATFKRPSPINAGQLDGSPFLPRVKWAGCLNSLLEFVALEKGLILRNFCIQSKKSTLEPLRVGLLLSVTVLCHILFFYVIGKSFPGEISYLSATLASFMVWNCFKQAKARAKPFLGEANFHKSPNIKWAHLMFADVYGDLIKIILSSVLTIALSHIFLSSLLVGNFVAPNIPLLLLMLVSAVFMGAGAGIAMTFLENQWPIFGALDHIFMWILFVTSGVYESYVQLPTLVMPYFKLNPILTIIEYSRAAFDPGYPVADLTLIFPCSVASGLLVLGLSLHQRERTAAYV